MEIKKPMVRKYAPPFIVPLLENVLGRLGYNKNKTIPDLNALEMVRRGIADSRGMIQAAALSLDDTVSPISGSEVIFGSGLGIRSNKAAALLKDCQSVTFMVCTIGGKITEMTEQLAAAGEMTRAVILDAVGSESVESLADFVTEILKRERALTGLKATMRYSPGYGDLPVEAHRDILPLLEAGAIGVSCRPDSFLLVPEKSITAFIGWYS